MNPYLDVISALNRSNVRYVVIGGFAVVAHGSNRFTPDINMIIDWNGAEAAGAIEALLAVGLRSDHPENDAVSFLDPDSRNQWIESGNLHLVMSNAQLLMFSAQIFLAPSIDFELLYHDAVRMPLYSGSVSVCSFDHLVSLKKAALRSQDLIDIENLEVVSMIGDLKPDQPVPHEILEALPDGFGEPRLQDLIHFRQLSTEERVEWLVGMLAGVGSFCFI